MSIDVYDDHIRFEWYHVPLDTSKLPHTTLERLVSGINCAIDEADAIDADRQAADAAKAERSRVLDLVATFATHLERAVDSENLKTVRAAVADLRKFIDEAGDE